MPANLENLAVPTVWKRLVFIPVPNKDKAKERSNYHTIMLISHASKVMLKSFKLGFNSTWTKNFQIYKLGWQKQRNQRSNCQYLLDHRKSKGIPENTYFCFIDYTKAFDCVDHKKLWKVLKEMGIPNHLPCLLRSLYVGQEATARTGHGTMDWFKTGKGVHQNCILSPCLFNLNAEYIMGNARLDDTHVRLKIVTEISTTSHMQMILLLWHKVKSI